MTKTCRIPSSVSFRPCSQIEEEIEDLDEGGDDSEMTCINASEMKQVGSISFPPITFSPITLSQFALGIFSMMAT
jgi:hypothetical protein